jgi:predicted dehydrogenase
MNQSESPLSRRHFIKQSTVVAAAATLPGWFLEESRSYAAAAQPRSANDKPGIALIGCGGQGRGDTNWAKNYGNVVAVCDVDANQMEQAAKQFTVDGKVPVKIKDFRRVLERDDVQVVINGTPDHWHTLVNLAAARAGKDIYSEKPLTLTIDEGKRLVGEVKKWGRLPDRQPAAQRSALSIGVRTGPQRAHRQAPIHVGRFADRSARRSVQPATGAGGDGFDFYLGQAPKVPYNGHNAHWNFRWWYAFSGGQMTDWGAHHNDIAQWGNGTDRSGPVYVDGKQLKTMIPGGYDAASDYVVYFKYANGVQMIATNQAPNGVRFEGTDGWIFVDRGQLTASNKELIEEPLPANAERLYKSDNHMGNFFECIRTRQAPICDAEIGHRSISVAHLGVISVRLGRPLQWNPEKEQFVGDREANKWVSREMRKPYDYSFIA